MLDLYLKLKIISWAVAIALMALGTIAIIIFSKR